MRDGRTATNYDPEKGHLFDVGTVTVGNCIYKGKWSEDGLLNGNAKVFRSDYQGLKIFDGNYENNERNGVGTFTWPNDVGTYHGPYKNGVRQTGENDEPATMVWGPGEAHKYVGEF